jgi:hypothetical protein
MIIGVATFIGNEVRARKRALSQVNDSLEEKFASTSKRLTECELARTDLLGELNQDRVSHGRDIATFQSEIKHLTSENRELRSLIMGEVVPPAMAAVIQTAVSHINAEAVSRTRMAVDEVLTRLGQIEARLGALDHE